MGLLDKIAFHVFDGAGAVISLIERWEPKRCKTEKDYEKSLVAHLRAELAGIAVTPQYAKGRIKCDLVVGEKVIVEIKKDMKSTGNCQRLVGQLSEYADWDGRVVVLLVGETDPDLRMNIEKAIHRLNGGTFGDEKTKLFVKD
jgi:hypothetical protein